jgi:preprotein translocase subunit SecB
MKMSDTPPDTAADAAVQDQNQPGTVPLRFLGQFIKDLSFETPHAPEIFNILRQQPPAIQISLDSAVRQLEGPVFEVTLSVNVAAKSGDKTAFIMELVYGCVAEVNTTAIPQEYVHSLLLIEVPRHIFPFVRQIVADMTGNAGFPPLMLQMVDFADLYRQKFAPKDGEQPPAAPAEPAVH